MATKVYRDFGALNNMSAPNNEFDIKRYTQVYQATHDGELRLPFMKRSFISFSFGTKKNESGEEVPVYIEDFNLVAYTDGDRLQRDAYASFEDLVTTYDVIPGQFYWGSYYHTNSLSLNLATDGMDQRDLDYFKYWFRAGSVRELILSEHPNRAIMARVSQPPIFKLLPFEQKVDMPFIEGDDENYKEKIYQTSTTLYKGEIELEFIMDEPFWYAKNNVLGIQDKSQGYYSDKWKDANGVEGSVMGNPDALKIIYEDHIPLGSAVAVSVFLGGEIYASVSYKPYAQIAIKDGEQDFTIPDDIKAKIIGYNGATWGEDEQEQKYLYYASGIITEDPGDDGSGQNNENNTNEEEEEVVEEFHGLLASQAPEEGENQNGEAEASGPVSITYEYWYGAMIATMSSNNDDTATYIGGAKISGADLDGTEAQDGIELPVNEHALLYYSGNAPSPVILTFSLVPTFGKANLDNSGNKNAFYIITPFNKYTAEEGQATYNTIKLTATMEHNFNFTLPTLWSNYNQVVKIFKDENIVRNNNAWSIVRETIRDTIRHPVIRAWANRIIDFYEMKYDSTTGIISQNANELRGKLLEGMQMLFLDTSLEPFSAKFHFNGKTGEAMADFEYRDFSKLILNPSSSLSLTEQINYSAYAEGESIINPPSGQNGSDQQDSSNEGSSIPFDNDPTPNLIDLEEINYTVKSVENVGDMVRSNYLILDERNVLDEHFMVQEWHETHPDYAYKIEHNVPKGLEKLHFEFQNLYL